MKDVKKNIRDIYMSIVAFKKKSVIQYGSNRSGKPPGGVWLPQGPFGKNMLSAGGNYGPVGFSLNGTHRNVGYVGKTYQMSKNGTPFRGIYPVGSGGVNGTYPSPPPVFNSTEVNVLGTQYKYVKPSVLSTKGMLSKKYRWAYNGQYPNNWVQPNYGGSMLSDTRSQGMYLHNLTTSNMCTFDINNSAKFEGNIKKGGSTLCSTTTAKFKYNDMASKGLYTKTTTQPLTASEQTLKIQKKCANPVGSQKPFPFGTNGDACNNTNYLTPPEWYVNSDTGINA
jgi:hypothetical protein